MMKVKELIERLKKCNPEAIVRIEYNTDVMYSSETWGDENVVANTRDINDLETWVAIVAGKETGHKIGDNYSIWG